MLLTDFGNKIHWNLNRNVYIFIQVNATKNVVWKMAAILYRLQCVNLCGLSEMGHRYHGRPFGAKPPPKPVLTSHIVNWTLTNKLANYRIRTKIHMFFVEKFICPGLNVSIFHYEFSHMYCKDWQIEMGCATCSDHSYQKAPRAIHQEV